MKELSLNILDIAMNSVRAGAKHVVIDLTDRGNIRTLTVTDDGCGMDAELLLSVTDPFSTTRTTRPVGLGLPLLQLAAEQTGGTLTVESAKADTGRRFAADSPHGTRVIATFDTAHIDCVPLGDLAETFVTLVQGSSNIDFALSLSLVGMEEPFALDTREMRKILGEDVPLDTPDVLVFIGEAVREALEQV